MLIILFASCNLPKSFLEELEAVEKVKKKIFELFNFKKKRNFFSQIDIEGHFQNLILHLKKKKKKNLNFIFLPYKSAFWFRSKFLKNRIKLPKTLFKVPKLVKLISFRYIIYFWENNFFSTLWSNFFWILSFWHGQSKNGLFSPKNIQKM